ncbi:MAG TPA: copper amine oxidase N-terminal domain-containing protein [Caldisericia bacterium]|nr:copper amine oxidase N-terminal domain-containing protein [Caldisericia bacterium]HPF49674.1 copper amine oxidase N-terminal domain-containing protein [Caldisericia bacterium]HPI84553.1 copper amine oxidase N-terminal domain-containing protein [Caldisericia bacterium]HPQ93668.1 copper amine oxidase N-terminal domain-containing protein [Caldisericia bacterium]HRV74768.1 copper amine oxidase N-terminal domain-containing protein [Caldisericia bacterium]
MKRTIVKVLSIMLVLSMLAITSPVTNTTYAGGGYNLTVTPGCGFNMLEWDAIPGAAHYWIYRGPGPGQEYSTPLTDFPISDTYFKDTINIQNGQLYCYFVKGVDQNADEFAQTIEACATPNCFEEDECRLVLKYQQGNVNYWVNDVEKGPMETPPVNKWNRLFLVVRYVTQEIKGTQLDWDATERKIIITTVAGDKIELWIGKNTGKVNGAEIQIDPNNPEVVPFIESGRTLLPMRFVAENLGATGPDDIKWFGDTKIVELRFDDPECLECDWILGYIKETTYHSGSLAAVTETTASHWEVKFRDCEGNIYTLYTRTDLPDINGVNPISEYRGCAELCIKNGVVIEWKSRTDLENCCGDEPSDCTPIYGKILSTTYDTMDNVWAVNFVACPVTGEVSVIYVAATDLLDQSGVFPISQYRGCATVCVVDHKIIWWKAYPDKTDCCEEEVEEDCFCVEIVKVDCSSDRSLVVGKTPNNTHLMIITTPEWCKKLQVGTCWEVCITADTPPAGTSGMFWKLVSAQRVECPCGGGTEEDCMCVEVVDPMGTRVMVKDADGNTWYLTFEDTSMIAQMKTGTCWEVCGKIVPLATSAYREFKVTSMTQVKCPCGQETKPECFCIEIVDPMCGSEPWKSYVKDKDGNQFYITLPSKDVCLKMAAGTCWYVCGVWVVDDASNSKYFKVAKWEQVKCPCGERIKEVCMCFTVDRTACDSMPAKVYGHDENGIKWVLNLDDSAACQEMKIGTCWRLCGDYEGGVEGNFRVLVPTSWEGVECPCVPEDKEICVCVEIIRNNCDASPPIAIGKDKKGNTWTLYLENDDICGMMQPGTCWSVCGWLTQGMDNYPKGIKVTSSEEVDCPCEGEEPPDYGCICVKVIDPACGQSAVYAEKEDGTRVVLQFVDASMCDKFEYDKCYEVCGEKIKYDDYGQLYFKVVRYREVECPCGGVSVEKCLCATVIRKVCGDEIDKVYIEDENGKHWLLLIDKNNSDMCEKMTPGTCWKICGMPAAGEGNMPGLKVYYIEKTPCPCVEGGEEKCMCVTVERVSCDTDPPMLYVKDENGVYWGLFMQSADECKEVKIGDCLRVCGWKIETSANANALKVTYWEKVPCPCADTGEEECICATVIEQKCNLDRPQVIVRDEQGRKWILWFEDSTECAKMKVNTCWTVCGNKTATDSGLLAMKVTYFEQVDCPCEQKEICICVEVQDPACQGDVPVVYVLMPDGKQIKLVFDDKYDCETMKQGECWEVCGHWIEPTQTTSVREFKVTSKNKVDCPCGQKDDCMCIEVIRVSCANKKVYAKSPDGKYWLLLLDSEAQCEKMKIGTCWEVCGGMVRTKEGEFQGYKITSMKQVACPCGDD